MRESFLTIPLFSRIIFSGSLNSQRFDKHSSQNIPTSLSNNTYPSHLSLPRLFPPTTRYQLSSLNTLAQRYVKSRDIECSLSREDTSRPSTKSEMIFFFYISRPNASNAWTTLHKVVVSGRFLCRRVPPKKRRKRQERWYQRNEFTVGGMKGNGIKEREGREGEEERKVLLQRRPRDITVGRIHYASQRLVFALFLRFDSLGLSLYRPIGL